MDNQDIDDDGIATVTYYKIWSPLGDKVYIGRATNFNYRQKKHIDSFIKGEYDCASHVMFTTYGLENCKFEVLEVVPDVIRQREQYWIDSNPKAVNTIKACMTLKDKKEAIRKNNEQQKPNRTQIILCECGESIQKSDLSRHKKSSIHKQKIEGTYKPPTDTKECDICHKSISSNHFARHKRTHTDDSEKRILCECGIYVLKEILSRHIKTLIHKQKIEGTYKPCNDTKECDICHKSISSKHLLRHKKTHEIKIPT